MRSEVEPLGMPSPCLALNRRQQREPRAAFAFTPLMIYYFFLAEVSDKMPTTLELWFWPAFLSLPILVALRIPQLRVPFIIYAAIVTALFTYVSADTLWWDNHFSQALQVEMSLTWKVSLFVSGLLPCAFSLFGIHPKREL